MELRCEGPMSTFCVSRALLGNTNTRWQHLLGMLVLLGVASSIATANHPVVEVMKVHGTGTIDAVSGIAYDHQGGVVVSGSTTGSIGGPYLGSTDAFLGKFDANGQELYFRQIGTSGYDTANDITTDQNDNIYVASSEGSCYACLRKYDAEGNLQWLQQFGSPAGAMANGVAADSAGNVWITGQTDGSLDGPSFGGRDAFIRKYDADGNLLWGQQLGTTLWDVSTAVAADPSGNSYITGFNFPGLFSPSDSQNFFVAKLDASGNVLWMKPQGGPLLDHASKLTTDAAGNVYVVGTTRSQLGSMQYGSGDIFVAKYAPDGTTLWTQQYGTSLNEFGCGIQVDAVGNIFVGETAANNPDGGPITSSRGALLKLNSQGDQEWKLILDNFPLDGVYDIALGEPGIIYAVSPVAAVPGRANGFYITKIRDVPEPIPGDFNADGMVDGADYVTWRKGLGTTYRQDDCDVWRANFGQSIDTSSMQQTIHSASSVPEPGAIGLLIYTAAGAWSLRRR